MNRKRYRSEMKKMDRKVAASSTRLNQSMKKPILKTIVPDVDVFPVGERARIGGNEYHVLLSNGETGEIWLERIVE